MQVYYSIVGGNTNNAFTISRPVTGIISTNVILDREVQSTYTLKIQASDGGSPSLTSTCTLRINVIDVNDNAPYFPTYAPISVSEGE
jgi:protocadherin-16/23